jgi:amidase
LTTTGYDNDLYREAKANLTRMGATEGIDAVLSQYNLDALVVPSEGFATRPAAVAGNLIYSICLLIIKGYPMVNVPLGTLSKTGLPFGLSFIGTV